jgi:rhodanese-related sulfurtransferase
MKANRNFPTSLALVFSLLLSFSFVVAASASDDATKPDLPKDKQTSLGLYVTSAEAYDKWQAAPDKVKVFDVRTLEEYLFVGHAPMAWNIPMFFQTHEWDADKGHFKMAPNPDFLSEVKQVASPDETILVMCRSGGRSAMAVNLMAENGYKNVYQITDGMEGDSVKDPLSVYNGKRLRNGWKNSGLPWTYKPDPEKILMPDAQEPAAEGK